MTRLIIWILLLSLLFGGYWFGATRAFNQTVSNAAVLARQNGWQIDYEPLQTNGFPARFDVRTAALTIVPADGRWAWQAPALQIKACSLQPTRISAALPNVQTLRLGDQTLQIESDDLTISAATDLNMALRFDQATVTTTEASILSDFGWRFGLDRADAAFKHQTETDATYDLEIDADGITIPAAFVSQLAQSGVPTNTIDRVVVDGNATLNRALDRFAVDASGVGPALERLVLTRFDMTWGDITLNASGALDVGEDGMPDGRITLRTAQWQVIIDLLVAMGTIDAGIAPTLGNMASSMVDDGGMLELPITFRDGFMSMGFLPLGPAPRLR